MKTFLQTLFFFLLVTQICFAQGSWTKINDMPEIRYGHTVNELDGKIYVVGGLNTEGGVSPTTALVYDTSLGWSWIPLYNNEIRWAHTSCVVDGNLYVIGGNDGNGTIATMDMFDPNTGEWESKDSMSIDRGLAASALVDGKIYVIGGMRIIDFSGLKTIEAYDPLTNTWDSTLADMPTKRWGHSAVAYNGKIYVLGGRSTGAPYLSVEVYDPQFNTWETLSDSTIPTPRYCLTACVLDSNIYAIGGWYHSATGPIYNKVEFYNSESNTWYTEIPMPVARAVLASIVLDSKIYVYGGACTTHPCIGTSAIYELSYDDIFAHQPYLDKIYARENIDTVLFRTRFSNIHNHLFTPHLIYANIDSTQMDSLTLFDDGLHGDSLVSDGLYGAYIPPRTIEDFFTLSISTIDNQTNKYYNTPDRCRFTTAGPVVLDSISWTQLSTSFYSVKPFLKNQSTVTTITDAYVSLICNDPWVTSITLTSRALPDIPPGAIVSPASPFTVTINNSIFPGYFNFEIEVVKNDWAYWTDSMQVGGNFQLIVSVANGWNMVSIPGLHPVNQNVLTWWPGKDPLAEVFKYGGVVYNAVNTATPGEGYWMKHLGANLYNTGEEWPESGIWKVQHNPIAGNAGWNLIGGYELSVGTAGITTNPPGLQSGPIYKYSGGYQVATTLDPGYGYWIKLTGSGQIIIPETLAKGEIEYFPDDWGKIVLTDATGINYTLYAVKGEVDLSQYELPPAPPQEMFDIRFSSGKIAENLNGAVQTIEMSGITYPLTVIVEGMDIRLMDETGKNVNVNLKAGEDVIISDATIQKLMVSGELLPTVYALEQNYPNPFNPSTVIEFSLPEDVSNVKLSIYNALGEKVAELVNTALVAGKYNYQWNAQNVATGMYIYELRTDKFVSVKKMLLLK